MTSAVPSGNTARTSRARMNSFTFSLRFCLRGGKFLPGYIGYARNSVLKMEKQAGGVPTANCGPASGLVRIRDKQRFRQIQCTTKWGEWGGEFERRRAV